MSREPADPRVTFLRHALATLAYRGGKTLRGAPASFATYEVGGGARTPVAILAHLGDLLAWSATLVAGQSAWSPAPPGPWDAEVDRFFAGLARLDALVARAMPADLPAEKLFQGPIADALTHVGQLAMLRRLAGAPVKGENYVAAEIEVGRVGPDQAAPRRELD